MDLRETEISNKPVFEGRFIDLNVETINLPSEKAAAHEIVKHPDASAAVAINDEKKILLVKQWRESIKQLTLEIPAGLVDETDASLLNAMKRELSEEGGCKVEYWEKVSEFCTSIGFCDEKIHLFYCNTLSKIEHKRPLGEDKFLIQEWYSLPELKQLIASGKIMGAEAIMAITFWEDMILTGNQSNN